MRTILTSLAVLAGFTVFATSNPNDFVTENPYQSYFDEAYTQNPNLQHGILEAVAFTNTRFSHLPATGEESCTGIPRAIGVMGMVQNGKRFFTENLKLASTFSGISEKEIIESPEKNILAYAAMIYELSGGNSSHNVPSINTLLDAAVACGELPRDPSNTVIAFARNSFKYSLAAFLSNKTYQQLFHFPDYQLDLPTIFGANYSVLSSSQVTMKGQNITGQNGQKFVNNGQVGIASDYGPAIWNPAATCNYTAGRTMTVTAVVIHDVEGTYAGCISWFQNCSAVVSAHYVVRSSDGQITQMVLESDKAWHVGSENGYTVGIEHEGYEAQTGWYTTAMYTNSAGLVANICSRHGINPKNMAFFPWAATTDYNGTNTPQTCVTVKGHQHYPNQTHIDPGPNWDWETFYRLVNTPAPTATVYTTTTGNFYDSGGSGSNYSNLERNIWTISPTGATTVTLNFTSFNTTSKYDYLYLYDGNSINAPLIGKYNGTTSPGTISSTGGSITAEFRSSCGTTSPGWAATWSINGTPPPGPDHTAPTTTVSIPGIWQTANFSTTFAEIDNTGGSGLFKSFYQVIDLNANGDWRANNTQGFFSDNFSQPSISPEWTATTGTWAINAPNISLEQSDQTLSNTNLYASLDQTLSNQYLYEWSGMISGTGANRRAGLHIFCDTAGNVNRGHSYFVWFRVDQSTLEIYKTANGAFSLVKSTAMTTVAGQWYDWKIVYDRIAGLLEVFQNNVFIGSYTDPSPIATGNSISFRSGNCDWQVQNFKVYRSRASNAPQTILVGSASNDMIRYQNPNPSTPSGRVKSIVRDSANNFSTIASQDVNVDWTPPSNPTNLFDGTGADMDTTYNGTQLSNNWNSSFDPNSGVSLYEFAIGTSSGGTNVLTWTGNLQDTTVTYTGLTLVPGTTYYTSVRTTNHAGLISSVVTSDGILYLSSATGVKDYASIISGLYAYPNPFNSSSTINYSLAESGSVQFTLTDVLGRNVQHFNAGEQAAGNHQVVVDAGSLSLAKGIYFLQMLSSGEVKTLKLSVR